MNLKTKIFTNETNKHNYKLFGFENHREFLREKKAFKLRVLKDLQNNPLILNNNYSESYRVRVGSCALVV